MPNTNVPLRSIIATAILHGDLAMIGITRELTAPYPMNHDEDHAGPKALGELLPKLRGLPSLPMGVADQMVIALVSAGRFMALLSPLSLPNQ